MLVKCWAKRRGIIDAKNGSLSSYVYMLLVIFFLQYRMGLLPSLQQMATQERKFGVNEISFLETWDGGDIGRDMPLTQVLCQFFT